VGVREGNEEREGGPGEVKKGERDREYDEWVPCQQNRRGRETTWVREMRGLEYPVLDIREETELAQYLRGSKGLNPINNIMRIKPIMEARPRPATITLGQWLHAHGTRTHTTLVGRSSQKTPVGL
jgi:hypothetical protein